MDITSWLCMVFKLLNACFLSLAFIFFMLILGVLINLFLYHLLDSS